MRKTLQATLIVFALTVSSASQAGGPNRIGGLGPRALGLSGAYTAIADDASSFYYNVAGISQIENNFVELGSDFCFPRLKFQLPDSWGGYSEKTKNKVFPMPLAAGIFRLTDKLVLGGGFYTPYGLGIEYPKNQRHGMLYQKSLLSLTNATIALSYEINDTLSIGAGLDIGWSQFCYNAQFHQVGQLSIDPLFLENSGNGFGMSWRLGFMFKPSEKFSWGFGYSAPMSVTLKGETDLSLFGLDLGNDHFQTRFTFPARFGTGVAYKPAKKLLLAFDANYYDYSGADKMVFNFNKLPTITQELRWRNFISLHFGVEYQLNDNWFVRTGAGWQGAPFPDSTMNPVMLDAKGFDWTCGLGYKKNDWSVDVAFVWAQASREIKQNNGHLAPGKYGAKIPGVSIGFGYKF